jgi:hypothetical protein
MIRTFGSSAMDPLAQAVAEIADEGVAKLLQLEERDDGLGARREGLFLAPRAAPVEQRVEHPGRHAAVKACEDILARGHARIGLDTLEGASDADGGAPVRAEARDVLAAERHRAALRPIES